MSDTPTISSPRNRQETASKPPRKRKAPPPQDFASLGDDIEIAPPGRKKTRQPKAVAPTSIDFTADLQGNVVDEKPKRRKRRMTPEEEREDEIAPIEEVLSTPFKGRRGYACLNTILRLRKPPVFCSRTCRIGTILKASDGTSPTKSLGLQNIIDTRELIRWNEQHSIKFMRLSSDMFPFASHEVYGYSLEYADMELKETGRLAKELGHRLTMHPGQFTQVGSPKEGVVKNAVRELEYHCEMLDRMGLDQDSVMIIHMGGVYGDKEATLARFKANYAKLPANVKGRLVLENDELCYNVDDLLPLCQELNIPLVFDYHHDWIYPSSRPASELIPLINETWCRKGIRPKQHYSEPRPGAVSAMEKRAHSDRVKMLPVGLPDDMDLMLECKDKEQAVLHLYRLYGLYEVDKQALRPPKEVETLQTMGRKGQKKPRTTTAADGIL